METLTRLVTESLARHGFDRPVDYRRLKWSHWFRCESHHSLLIVPSKPGVFALAEEVMSIPDRVATDPLVRPANQPLTEAKGKGNEKEIGPVPEAESPMPEADSPRRMLAVRKFFEDDDMAFVLDRMLSHQNPMRERLTSGRYFVRFVVIEDPSQRRSICSALTNGSPLPPRGRPESAPTSPRPWNLCPVPNSLVWPQPTRLSRGAKRADQAVPSRAQNRSMAHDRQRPHG